jgi:ABC-2 type transport system ATP-binding protein
VRWIRHLLRSLAAEGRTVFVSSHLMSEMALTADHLIVVGRGKLIANASMAEFTAMMDASVRVRVREAEELRERLVGPAVTVELIEPDVLQVHGMDSSAIGLVACRHGIALDELTPVTASLEDAFMDMTKDAVEYREAS